MTGILSGRPAIVTGAGRGVGRGIALALASEGAEVAVLERSEDTFGDTCDEIARRGGRSIPVLCDVREPDQVTSAVATVVEQLGGVRILVNNAQMTSHGPLLELDEQDLDDGWRSGPLAALRFMQACHPHLRDGGAVVNISSGAATLAGPPGMAGYAAVKAALQTFSRAAAVEWGRDGIRVNTVQPLVTSPGYEQWLAENPDKPRSLDHVPMGRMGDAELDVGRTVVFLVGPDAGMITGTIVPVDGGSAYLR